MLSMSIKRKIKKSKFIIACTYLCFYAAYAAYAIFYYTSYKNLLGILLVTLISVALFLSAVTTFFELPRQPAQRKAFAFPSLSENRKIYRATHHFRHHHRNGPLSSTEYQRIFAHHGHRFRADADIQHSRKRARQSVGTQMQIRIRKKTFYPPAPFRRRGQRDKFAGYRPERRRTLADHEIFSRSR